MAMLLECRTIIGLRRSRQCLNVSADPPAHVRCVGSGPPRAWPTPPRGRRQIDIIRRHVHGNWNMSRFGDRKDICKSASVMVVGLEGNLEKKLR